jgi:hypothetical protein
LINALPGRAVLPVGMTPLTESDYYEWGGRAPSADQLLPPPGIDRLGTDLQIMRDLSDGPPGGDQVQDLPAEFCRVTPRRNVLHGMLDG